MCDETRNGRNFTFFRSMERRTQFSSLVLVSNDTLPTRISFRRLMNSVSD